MIDRRDLDEKQIAAQAKATSQAIEWVSRILAVVAVMVLPGVGGQWLDERFGTHVLSLIGFVLGLIVGITALIALVTPRKPPDRKT